MSCAALLVAGMRALVGARAFIWRAHDRSSKPLLLGIRCGLFTTGTMRLAWKSVSGEDVSAPILEPIRSYVERLGVETTVALLLELGGAYVYIPSAENGAGVKISSVIGEDAALKLADKFGGTTHRLPLGKPFLIRALRQQGASVAEIVRRVGVTDTTVRANLRSDEERRALTRKISRSFAGSR